MSKIRITHQFFPFKLQLVLVCLNAMKELSITRASLQLQHILLFWYPGMHTPGERFLFLNLQNVTQYLYKFHKNRFMGPEKICSNITIGVNTVFEILA